MTANNPLKPKGGEETTPPTEGARPTLDEFVASIDTTLSDATTLSSDQEEAAKKERKPHFTLSNSPTRPVDDDDKN